VSKIKSLLRKNKSSASDSINIKAPIIQGQESLDCINLKHLPLPTFTGKYGEWFTFYESFKCLVANNANISEIRKFHYLRGCLKDEALRAIESLSISGDNYVNAIELLRKRFENKRGNFHHCRAVLDQCSKVSLITITESMCKKLNLRTYSSNACITGVNVSENIAPRPFHLKSQRLSYLPILF
jgi:hypothetical protein